MTNHVHLIVQPGGSRFAIGELMTRLAGRQTRFVNKMERRTGSLWDSRYKISPIRSDEYLLQCCRYVELNPVKAKMVESAELYPWSSYAAKIGLVENRWLNLDPCFLSLDATLNGCRRSYTDFVSAGLNPEEQRFIQEVVERNQLTGIGRFVDEVETRIEERIECRGRGRPVKEKREKVMS